MRLGFRLGACKLRLAAVLSKFLLQSSFFLYASGLKPGLQDAKDGVCAIFSQSIMTPRKTIGILALILLFGFILRIPYLFHTMQDIDEGCHAAVAAALMDGGLPYLTAVDNKPPGIFYIYLVTFYLFGKYNMTAIHMVTFLWTLATGDHLEHSCEEAGRKKRGFVRAAVLSDVYCSALS